MAALRLGRAVANCILGDARYDIADDGRDARPLPVFAVDVEADGQITAILRVPCRQYLVRGRRFGVAEERRPEELQGAPGERFEQSLRRVQLEQGPRLVDRGEIGMRVGVAADLVALADHALEQAALGEGILADNEEGRVNLLLLEDVEDMRCPARVRTVVEGQRDLTRAIACSSDCER